MPVTLNVFQQLANSTVFDSRDLIVDNSNKVKLGNLVFSSGRKTNDATMAAFRNALSQKYGVFGEHAFDTVLGSRAQMHKSLRASDVKATLSQLPALKEKRYYNEISRQLDTDPKMRELSSAMRKMVREEIAKNPLGGSSLKNCATATDLNRKASARISDAIRLVSDLATAQNALFKEKIDTSKQELGDRKQIETEVQGNEPTGLRNLENIFKKGQTSIEDKIKTGSLGVGMRINRSSTNPVLLEKLKTNGVEPGFIYKNDWSLDDTKGMLTDYESDASKAKLEELKNKCPELAAKCADLPLREQIMLCGRAHPACMAAVTDFILEKGMADDNSAISKAFEDKFPKVSPELRKTIPSNTIKKALFTEIRDAVLNVKKDDDIYNKSPIFKHFNERHIVKLDYNESNRIFTKDAASAGKFMRPERIVVGRKMGQLYRLQTATTANNASVGAVTEALANDLTRLAGVPSQELSIVRGQYSDGHPKLMLEAKFAQGYKDMENGYIKDGQIVPPQGEKVESLGKYKAFFLVTADRDAVGSRGQNKGFAQGKFFAIDPGHSLEGNGRFLEVDDNLSFKDTYGFSTKPRFKNFSVFDDDTRFAKFQGALDLRTLKNSGKIGKLFDDYRATFNPNKEGLSKVEKELRLKIQDEIGKKEAEFRDSMAKILNVVENQFKLYDDLASEGAVVQEKAIETIENLEKLTSPTTWVSPKGEVPLKHLSVIPETRIAWRGHVDGDEIVYHCDQPLSKQARDHLRVFAQNAGATLQIDATGCAKLSIAKAGAEKAMNVFSENNVAKVTHTQEAIARTLGKSGLEEARNFAATQGRNNAVNVANEPHGNERLPDVLPDRLEVRVGNDTLTFRKQHYEAMIANTPEAERPKSLDDLKNILATRVQQGRDILKAVYEGNGHRYAATPRNVASVTLALHAGTVKKGEYNERGAFSVSDPDGKLYQWLDTCKDVYMRTSTHAQVYHHKTVDGHTNMPRGLDIPEGIGGLMGGMRTLHYFTLPEANGQPRRLYLKCETYGIYRSTISKSEEESSRAPGMQTRPKRTGDTRESIKHCLSLFTMFTRMGRSEGNRKENTPQEIKDALATAQRDLRRDGLGNLANILGKDVGGGGIRMLLENMTKILEVSRQHKTVLGVTDRLLETITGYAESRTGEASARMGNEVMLDAHEIL